MNRAVVYASASALSAMICIALTASSLVAVVYHWHPALLLIVTAVAFGFVAKFTDRLKMRRLYGRVHGDRLHQQPSRHSALAMAHRDFVTYRRLTGRLQPCTPHGGHADQHMPGHTRPSHMLKPLFTIMGAVVAMVLLVK